MRLKSTFIASLFLVCAFNTSFAQMIQTPESYNLPPGFQMTPDRVVFDLSYKLIDNNAKSHSAESLTILKDLTEAEFTEASPAYQQYVLSGKEYINNLPNKVKSIYTEVELWYIYAFDQNLKNQLQTIQ